MTITWRHFPAGEHGFFRAPVLLAGASEAILIDGGFTFADGRKVADAIRASGKRLTTVYVSQSDPDYYFSLAPIRAAFPDARFIAAEAAVAAIRANVQKKLDTWGPQLKDNGPQTLADVVFPVVFNDRTLELEGETIEIILAAGQPNARTLWVPSLRALFGGVLVLPASTSGSPTRLRASSERPGCATSTLSRRSARRSSSPATSRRARRSTPPPSRTRATTCSPSRRSSRRRATAPR